jgi:hypothetical protein
MAKRIAVKLCSGCGESKLRREFYRSRVAPDGLQYRCKMCGEDCKMEGA